MKKIVNFYTLHKRDVLLFTVLSAIIVIFFTPFLSSRKVLPSDWDYFAQAYEAARRSIVVYHQFPWWNAWSLGGVPLYANPQFGVFSIQMLLVIVLGTLTGLRVSVVVYCLLGFWGMRQLLIKLKSTPLQATLLAYIWVFSAFPIWHLSVGHFTFTTYFIAPWLFYFLLDIHTKRLNWLYAALIASLALQSSFHYTTIQLCILAAVFSIVRIIKELMHKDRSAKVILKPYVKMLLLFLIINLHRIYYTLNYLHDYPRIPARELKNPISLLYTSLTFRGSRIIDTANWFGSSYAWHEYAAYFGVITLILFGFLVISRMLKPYKYDLFWVFTLMAASAFILALGPFFKFSPYSLLKTLPGFEQMQVASRWLGWFVFFVLLSLSALPKRKIITLVLIVSLCDVSQSSFGVINRSYPNLVETHAATQDFNQYTYYVNDPTTQGNNLRLFKATYANVGEVYGYEPILGFGADYNEAGYSPLSLRCGINRGCPLVLTHNAQIMSWSPNLILLARTAPGNIELNMNPGNRWTVNGKPVFRDLRILELKKPFTITDSSQRLVIADRYW